MIRSLTVQMLSTHGYNVLEGATGNEALLVAQTYPSEIHLLLTEFILPDTNGKEVSEMLRNLRPAIKVLFMSGYPDDVLAPRGVLDPRLSYLAKPFGEDALLTRIREVLTEDIASAREQVDTA